MHRSSALERGRANIEHAGVRPLEAHTFVADDAFAWLARAARRGERFDLVRARPAELLEHEARPLRRRQRLRVAGRRGAGDPRARRAPARVHQSPGHRRVPRFRRILVRCGPERRARRRPGQGPARAARLSRRGGPAPHMKSALVTLAGRARERDRDVDSLSEGGGPVVGAPTGRAECPTAGRPEDCRPGRSDRSRCGAHSGGRCRERDRLNSRQQFGQRHSRTSDPSARL